MISHDQFAKALERQNISLSDRQINLLLLDLFPNPQSGFSVGGVSVWGDSRSIRQVQNWHHDSVAVVPALRSTLINEREHRNG